MIQPRRATGDPGGLWSHGIAEKIEAVLDNPRFLRAPLDRSRSARTAIDAAVDRKLALPVLLFWGKGLKPLPDSSERQAVRFLARYSESVASVWPAGIAYHVIFADTHAVLNGHAPSVAASYFNAVRSLFGPVRARFESMSRLWRDDGVTWESVHVASRTLSGSAWRRIDEELELTRAASVHAQNRDPAWSARVYYVVRRRENEILSRHFAGWFHATSDSPTRRRLLPDLPTLHTYSMARGRCAKPWFQVSSSAASAGSGVEPCAA